MIHGSRFRTAVGRRRRHPLRGRSDVGARPLTTAFAVVLLAGLLLGPPATGGIPGEVGGGVLAPPVTPVADHAPLPDACGEGGCTEKLTGSGGWKLQVYRNVPLSGSAAVTRAVVVVHGTGRNAEGYFSGMMAAARSAGVQRDTLVVAPWFKTEEDKPGSGEAVWTSGAWKRGDGATSPSGLSSFTVMDQLISVLANKQRFPNLTHVTVAGHSAGGQFTQRYAALGTGPNSLRGVTVSYVPANPSSYLYFGPGRPSKTGLAVPSSGSCPDYDTYKYGMKGRSGYPARLTPAQAMANYTSRRVTIINGGADTTDNGDLDTDCGAMFQGANRAVRGANYARYIRSVAASAPQSRIVVPGVDHDGDEIFSSPLARSALFGVNP